MFTQAQLQSPPPLPGMTQYHIPAAPPIQVSYIRPNQRKQGRGSSGHLNASYVNGNGSSSMVKCDTTSKPRVETKISNGDELPFGISEKFSQIHGSQRNHFSPLRRASPPKQSSGVPDIRQSQIPTAKMNAADSIKQNLRRGSLPDSKLLRSTDATNRTVINAIAVPMKEKAGLAKESSWALVASPVNTAGSNVRLPPDIDKLMLDEVSNKQHYRNALEQEKQRIRNGVADTMHKVAAFLEDYAKRLIDIMETEAKEYEESYAIFLMKANGRSEFDHLFEVQNNAGSFGSVAKSQAKDIDPMMASLLECERAYKKKMEEFTMTKYHNYIEELRGIAHRIEVKMHTMASPDSQVWQATLSQVLKNVEGGISGGNEAPQKKSGQYDEMDLLPSGSSIQLSVDDARKVARIDWGKQFKEPAKCSGSSGMYVQKENSPMRKADEMLNIENYPNLAEAMKAYTTAGRTRTNVDYHSVVLGPHNRQHTHY